MEAARRVAGVYHLEAEHSNGGDILPTITLRLLSLTFHNFYVLNKILRQFYINLMQYEINPISRQLG
jgi:hypothetical protein